MSRIGEKFDSLRKENKKALITYITSGDPNLDRAIDLVLAMEKGGADIVELGIPYSDPLADGPIIQRASQRALEGGVNIDGIFHMILRLREETQIPLVFLVYYNSIYKYGIKKFLDCCKEKGIDGLIIPDLPLEERKELNNILKSYPIDLIPIVAPTSEDRIREITVDAKGFVYCISSKGVTGMREKFEENLGDFIDQVKKYTNVPLAIGFGISDERAVRNLKDLSHGLIIGSAIVQKIEDGIKNGDVEERVFDFVKKLRKALD